MNESVISFMQATLGEDAFSALIKAGERSSSIANVLGPRTIMGWVNLASRWNYDGFVPGHEESVLQFTKSENGLTGTVAIGDRQLDFENAKPENLAAMLCVGLGCVPALAKSEDGAALNHLGVTIDLMVKQRVVTLLKAEGPPPRCVACNKFYSNKHKERCPHCNELFAKTELPGKTAGAIPPDAPESQNAPQAKAPRRMATAKPISVSMTKSMMEKKCSVCESSQFTKSGEFKGCWCLRDLARFAKSEPKGDGCVVTFDKEWTRNNITLLVDIVGAGDGE